jgi:hypothetical protein
MKLKPILAEMDSDLAKLRAEKAALDGDITELLAARKGLVDLYGDGNPKFELPELPELPEPTAAAPAKRAYKKRAKKAGKEEGITSGDVELLAAARSMPEPFTATALAVVAGRSDASGKKLCSNRCSKWRRKDWLASGTGGYTRTKEFPPE